MIRLSILDKHGLLKDAVMQLRAYLLAAEPDAEGNTAWSNALGMVFHVETQLRALRSAVRAKATAELRARCLHADVHERGHGGPDGQLVVTRRTCRDCGAKLPVQP